MVAQSPENQEKPEVSGEEPLSSSFSKHLPTVQFIVTIAIAIGGFFVSSTVDIAKTEIEKANHKINEITTKFEKNKKFSDEISKTIDELSVGKPTKAKMTLVRLYTLAEDPKEKYILVNLASASDREELIETVASLLEGENPEGIKEDVFVKYPILAATKAKIARKIDKTSPATQQELNFQPADLKSATKPLVNDEMVKAETPKPLVKAEVVKAEVMKAQAEVVKAEANLLSQLTPEELTGWVFLGRENRQTKKFESDVIFPAAKPPIRDQQVTLIKGMNIRQKRPPQNYTLNQLPRLVGALRKGSTIKIIDISRVFSERWQVGVWARIEVVNKV